MVSGAAEFFVKRNDPQIQKLLIEMLWKTKDGVVAQAFAASPDPVLAAEGRKFGGSVGLTLTSDEKGNVTLEEKR